MTEITNVIRWNANFVRGLAQSVLDRARVIRGTLAPTGSRKAERKTKAKSGGKARRVRSARKSGG